MAEQRADPVEARQIVITGLVQGIGYRWSMVEAARNFGVTGWVRNRRDGSVEACLCGDGEAVARLVAWARRGPPGASVEHVHVELAEAQDFSGFELRPTD
jgi:acylphosphatase